MPFHPEGLDHETLKKLAKNLKKGFPKVFPIVPIATHQAQALLALAFGYEHWHEALTTRDPSSLPVVDHAPALPPTLDDAVSGLHQALPGGGLVIPVWDEAVNHAVFSVLHQQGLADTVRVLSPSSAPWTESVNVKVSMKQEISTETLDLFQKSVEADPTSSVTPEATASDASPTTHDLLLWSDLNATLLVFEGFLAYLNNKLPFKDAIAALAQDLHEMEHPDLAIYLTTHWTTDFANGRTDRWARLMAQVLKPTSPRAAHAVLRMARLSHSPVAFTNALRPVVGALQDSVREATATSPFLRDRQDLEKPKQRSFRRKIMVDPVSLCDPLTPALQAIIKDTVEQVVQGGGTVDVFPPAIARFSEHLRERSDGEVLAAMDALCWSLAQRLPSLCAPLPAPLQKSAEQSGDHVRVLPTIEVRKTIAGLMRENDPTMSTARITAIIQGLLQPVARYVVAELDQ